MREIKIRIWDKGDKKMKYAEMEHFDDMIGFRFEHKSFEADGDESMIEIMQFTGLLDKNGKEVYESDICKMYGTSNQFAPYLYKIVFFEGAFCLEPIGFDMTGHQSASFIYTNDILQEMDMGRNISKHIEVIGNLYENQNLLEK